MDAPASLGVPAIHFLFQRRLLSEETYIDLVLNLEFHAFIAAIATDEVGRDIDGLGNCGLDQFYYRSGSLSRSSASFATTLAEYSFRNSLNSDSVLVLFR